MTKFLWIMKYKILLLLLFTHVNYNAQITLIPDLNFEQALIDLNIDSDGVLNGQVLTNDVDSVVILDVNHKSIQDLTGIEDFFGLEYLNVSGNELMVLDVSYNIQLKELYCNSQSGGFSMFFSYLDFSNNVNLELLHGENLIFLESLNLKNGNNSILTVTLPCEFEGEPCELTELNCVTVDNEEAATNDEIPYFNWTIQADFVYSEDCNLGLNESLEKQLSIYPNPAKNVLMLFIESDYNIKSVNVYDTLGKVVLEQKNPTNQIDISNISSGLLFVKIETDEGVMVKKIIKKSY